MLTAFVHVTTAQTAGDAPTEKKTGVTIRADEPVVLGVVRCAPNKTSREAEKSCNSGLDSTIKQQYTAAIDDFTRAIELDAKYADAYRRRAVAFSFKKDDDRALADLNKVIELAPNETSAYLSRGSIYLMSKKEYELAVADFTRVIELEPRSALNYGMRAFAYQMAGKTDLAAADRQKAGELDALEK